MAANVRKDVTAACFSANRRAHHGWSTVCTSYPRERGGPEPGFPMRASLLLVLVLSVSIVLVGFREAYPGEVEYTVPSGYRAATKIKTDRDSWKQKADAADTAALLAAQFETENVQVAVKPEPASPKAVATPFKKSPTAKTVVHPRRFSAKKFHQVRHGHRALKKAHAKRS